MNKESCIVYIKIPKFRILNLLNLLLGCRFVLQLLTLQKAIQYRVPQNNDHNLQFLPQLRKQGVLPVPL